MKALPELAPALRKRVGHGKDGVGMKKAKGEDLKDLPRVIFPLFQPSAHPPV